MGDIDSQQASEVTGEGNEPIHESRKHMSCFRHGMHGTPTYRSWGTMIQRCTNPNEPHYADYGGRGISVCERWLTFANFFADMGERPEGTTLDRREGSGNYEPGNCRWASRTVQQRNKRDNLRVTYCGETLTLIEWSERLQISFQALRARYRRNWPAEQMLTTPVTKSNAYRRANHKRDEAAHFTRKAP